MLFYNNKTHLFQSNPSLFRFIKAYHPNILNELFPQKQMWTLNACKREAKKYTTRTKWQNGSPGSYHKARTSMWLKNCCGHMINYKSWHTLKTCIDFASRCSTIKEFKKRYPIAYDSSKEREWLGIVTSHMMYSK